MVTKPKWEKQTSDIIVKEKQVDVLLRELQCIVRYIRSWGAPGAAPGFCLVMRKVPTPSLPLGPHLSLTPGTFLLHVQLIPLLAQAKSKSTSECRIKPLEGQIQHIHFC